MKSSVPRKQPPPRRNRALWLSLAGVALQAWSCGCCAGQVLVTVTDSAGALIADAVVALIPAAGHASDAKPAQDASIDQVNKQFRPHVSALQAGTTVHFPNSDNIRHQVYSFSEAKRFETKLYSGKAAAPVVFDKPGVIVLGCNIHDTMRGYVYVVDTPYFAKTDNSGRALIVAPDGAYTLQIWHPRYASGRSPAARAFQVLADQESREVLALGPLEESSTPTEVVSAR